MHPIFLSLGNFQIHWYGVMAAIAAYTAYRIILANRDHASISKDQASTIVFYCILIGGMVGARIFYVILNWHIFSKREWYTVFFIQEGGLVFYGGFFLAAALIVLYCRKQKLSLIATLDVVAPALAIGHGIARIGCFLQGCCHGTPTKCLLGVKYPEIANIYPGQSVHPVQIYEMAANFIFGILLFYLVRKARRGVAFSSYIIGYGAIRFSLEFLRGDDERGVWGIFSTSQIICLLLIPFGIAMILFFATGKDAFASLKAKEESRKKSTKK